MKHNAFLAGVIGLALGIAGTARAEPYTLERAVDYALAHNPQLAASGQQAQAAQAERRAAQGAYLPTLDLNYFVRRSDNALDAFADKLNTRSVVQTDLLVGPLNNPDPSTLYGTQVSLQLPLFTGGETTARVRGAKAAEQAADLQRTRTRQITIYQTSYAYLAAQSSTRGLAITDAAVLAAQEHANTTARLLRQGRIITSDKLTAEVNLAAMQALREKARTRTQLALHQLKRIMGLPADSDVDVLPWPAKRTPFSADTLANLTQQALQQRSDLNAMAAQVNAARANVEAARAAHMPRLSVVANKNWYDDEFGTDSDSWSVMGVATVNLFAGGRYHQQVVANKHRATETQDQLRANRLHVQNEVYDAYSRWQEANARLAIATDSADKAQRTVELVKGRYGQGRTILIDLLQAERALIEARNEALLAGFDYETTLAALRLADGSLDVNR